MSIHRRTIIRCSKIGAIFLALAAVVSLIQPAAQGYEISIYSSAPIELWIFLSIALGCSIVTVCGSKGNEKLVSAGISISLVTYLVLFTIPASRGYILYGRGKRDILAHIGFAKNLNNWFIAGDWYPSYHFLLHILRNVGGIDWEFTVGISAVAFSALFITSVTALSRSLLPRSPWWISTSLSIVPFMGSFHRSGHPAVFAFMIIPIVWFVMTNLNDNRFQFLTILLLLATIPVHPVSSGLLLVILVIELIILKRQEEEFPYSGLPIAAVGTVAMLFWYLSFNRISGPISSLLFFSFGGAAQSQASAATGGVLSPIEIFIRFIEIYGASALVLGFGSTGVLYWLVEWIKNGDLNRLVIHWFVGVVIGLAFLLVDLIVASPLRAAQHLLVVSILTGPVGFNWIKNLDNNQSVVIALIAIIVLAGVIGMGAVYPPNGHLSESEYAGSTHQDRYLSEGHATNSLNVNCKMDWYLSQRGYLDQGHCLFVDTTYPRNLGYDRNDSISSAVREDSLVTKRYDLLFYQHFNSDKQPLIKVYNRSDRERLYTDTDAYEVYTNGGYQVWRISD